MEDGGGVEGGREGERARRGYAHKHAIGMLEGGFYGSREVWAVREGKEGDRE